MKLIDDWLTLAGLNLKSLEKHSGTPGLGTPEAAAISLQIVELKRIMKETEKNGFFPDEASQSHLIHVSSREHLKIEQEVIEGIGYLFDISSRAIRLGPEKSNNILKVNLSEQGGVGNVASRRA